MNLLPPPGPQRTRLVVMIVALALMAGAYSKWGGGPELVIPTSTGPAATPRVQAPPRAGAGTRSGSASKAAPGQPVALKLKEMEEQLPDEPQAGRNPFRYGVKPPPPPPPYVPPPPPPPPGPPPPPPGPPPIPLKLTTIFADPYVPGRSRVYLVDKSGAVFEAVEGQIVDGRYKLVKVGSASVVMSYLDGTGMRTITLGG